ERDPIADADTEVRAQDVGRDQAGRVERDFDAALFEPRRRAVLHRAQRRRIVGVATSDGDEAGEKDDGAHESGALQRPCYREFSWLRARARRKADKNVRTWGDQSAGGGTQPPNARSSSSATATLT